MLSEFAEDSQNPYQDASSLRFVVLSLLPRTGTGIHREYEQHVMPKFQMSIAHGLGVDELRDRVERTVAYLKQEYALSDVEEQWIDSTLRFAFRVKGFRITGSIGLGPEEVSVVAKIPMVAAMFKGRIEAQLRQAIERSLEQ
jgi:putative polyhydroxyalkanoate system protein